MIKMMAAACRRPGMTHAEYIDYIHRVHAAIARENPVTLQRYVQNHVFDGAFGTQAEATHRMVVSRDSVTELYWPSFEAMGQTFAHPYTQQKVGPDGANFADLRVSLSLVAEELECPVPQPGAGSVKVLHFLRMAPGLSLAQFFERWASAHTQVLAQEPAVATALRRCVHSRQLTQGNAMLAHFGAEETQPYEGVASLWFDEVASLGLFRRYESALLRLNAVSDQAFYAPAASFFLYAHEVDVL